MTTVPLRAPKGSRRILTTLAPALIAAVLLAAAAFTASAVAAGHGTAGRAARSARPGAPAARTPTGTIAAVTPTFTWGKAARATRYELRVSNGSALLLKKTGITKLSWKSGTALP